MSIQHGRGGMGSHKHGVSGESGMPSGLKQQLAREDNKRRIVKKGVGRFYDSIEALMKARRVNRTGEPASAGNGLER